MYNDVYELPKPKFEITLAKALVVLNTLLITLVIPILVITYYKREDSNFLKTQQELANQYNSENSTLSTASSDTGRVAGVSTANNDFKLPIIDLDLDLDSQGGALILTGIVLMGISIILALYLLIDNQKVKNIS